MRVSVQYRIFTVTSKLERMNLRRSAIFHRGMTLIEVVAALVLMATLLTTALAAYGRTIRQQKVVQNRTQALLLAEEKLASWIAVGPLGQQLPEPLKQVSEAFEESPEWMWRLTRLDREVLVHHPEIRLEMEIFRFEIFRTTEEQSEEGESFFSIDLTSRLTPVVPVTLEGIR